MRRSDSVFDEVSRSTRRKLPRIRVENEQKYFTFGEILGQGRFGIVITGTKTSDKKDYAVKMISKRNVKGHATAPTMREKLAEREIYILGMVDHPHIIFLDSVYETIQKLFLVFELCPKQLAKVFRQKEMFPETDTRQVIERLASAVAYLHRQEIVHRDLKLENIMIGMNPADPDDELYIKVIDFGLSAVKGHSAYDNVLQEFCGTVMYMAPEIISEKMYSQQCDVWAMGVIMYLLLSGKMPFYSTNEIAVRTMIKSLDLNFSDAFWAKNVSCEALHLLVRMLNKNPAYRITAHEIQHHPWILQKKMEDIQHTNILEKMNQWKDDLELAENVSWVTLESKKSNECLPINRFDVEQQSERKEPIVTPVCRSSFKNEYRKIKMRSGNRNITEQGNNSDPPLVTTNKIRNADLIAQLRSLPKTIKSTTPSARNSRRSSDDSSAGEGNKLRKKRPTLEKIEIEEKAKSKPLNSRPFKQSLYIPLEPQENTSQNAGNSMANKNTILKSTPIRMKDSGSNENAAPPQREGNSSNEDDKSKSDTKKNDKTKPRRVSKESKEGSRRPSKSKKRSAGTAESEETKERVLEAIQRKIKTNFQ